MRIQGEWPEKLGFLFEPKRYKVLYGGRGAAKSWGVARALLTLAAIKPLRILCAREFQNSIAESVHELLATQIVELGLSGFYSVQNASITGQNGSGFFFSGLRHNVSKIKSFENVDVCWVEEAQTVSKSSWATLIPTIRKPGSEIWVTFNPELEDDETYVRFVKNPPPEAEVVKINWTDNPWFPPVLDMERKFLQETDPDSYLTVWDGHCRVALDGAVYADELRNAKAAGRITKVPYTQGVPVDTFWDLGRADNTAVWFIQRVGFEWRAIDYLSSNAKHFSYYLRELQNKPYVYGIDYMPHDAEAEQLAAEKTVAGQARAVGRRVHIVPSGPGAVANGINAARTLFPSVWFDEDKCADGLQCLAHYRYDKDPDTGKTSKEPVHDWASHGADAFRTFAVGVQEPKGRKRTPNTSFLGAGGGWMR